MAKNPELKVRISAELNQIKQSLSQLQNDLVKVGGTGAKAGKETAAGFNSIETAAKRAVLAVGAFFTVQGAIALTKQIAQTNSEYIAMTARLKIAAGETANLAATQQALFEISQRTSTELAANVDLYTNIARSTKNVVGVTDEMRLRLTDIIGKYTAISGGGQAANQALRQLGQALSSNFSSAAQEINSITDALPALSNAMVDAFGLKSTKELKDFAEQGKLTTATFVAAMVRMGEKADEQFGGMADTVEKAMQRLKNEVTKAIGEADLSRLTGSIGDLSRQLSDPANVQALQSFATGLSTIASWAVSAAASIGEMGQKFGFLAAKIAGGVTEMDDLEQKIRDVDAAIKGGFLDKPVAFAFKSKEELKEIKEGLEIRRDLLLKYGGIVEGVVQTEEEATRAANARKKALEEQAAQLEENAKLEAANKKAAEEAADAEKDRIKSLRQLLDGLQEQADLEGKTAEQVALYRLQNLKATPEEIARGLALVRTTEALKNKAEAEKEAADAAKRAAEEAKREWDKLLARNEKAKADSEVRIAEIEGRSLDARLIELGRKYQTQLDDMIAASDTAGAAMVQKLWDKERTQAQFDELKRQYDKVLEELAKKEESLANRVRIGDISQLEADRQLGGARAQAQSDAGGIVEQAGVLASVDPALQESVDLMTEKLNNQRAAATGLVQAQNELGQSLTNLVGGFAAFAANAAVDGLSQAMTDIIDGTKSAGEAMKDFVRGMAQAMLEMVTRIVATMAILQVISAVTGVPVAALAQFAGMSANVGSNHTGGLAGTGARRNVNPLVFAGAPRYHSGGVAGLKPGEVPSILQKGEEVLTRDDPRHQANGGGQQSGGGTRVINVIDPNMVSDYMSSSNGEKVLLNVLQRNSGAIKQVMT